MADDKKPQSNHVLISTACLFFGYMLITKFETWLNQSRQHQLVIAGNCSITFFGVSYWALNKRKKLLAKRKLEAAIIGPDKNCVFCGTTDEGEAVFIKTNQRVMHTQIIGTTNAGKTESVILPWAIHDIEQGRGLILIDGKSDKSLLDKLWAYAVKNNRQKDFRLFSLSNIDESFQFNPLIGGTPEEISERIFNSFEFENPYYRSIQFEVFSQVMRILTQAQVVPTFLRLHQTIANPAILKKLTQKFPKNDPLKQWADYYKQ